MGVRAPLGFRKDFRAAYRAGEPGRVDNSLAGLPTDEVLPPRDGTRVWRVTDRPVHDGERFLPHGGNVSAPGLDERFESRRRRWVAYVADRLQAERETLSRPQAEEIAAELWKAEHAAKVRAAKVPAESKAHVPAVAMRARLIARMQRYRETHGRPMPAPMVRQIARTMGLAA